MQGDAQVRAGEKGGVVAVGEPGGEDADAGEAAGVLELLNFVDVGLLLGAFAGDDDEEGGGDVVGSKGGGGGI